MEASKLILVRHAKSDWDIVVPDIDRPLASRGRRQAPRTGKWLAEQAFDVGLVALSPAVRAQETWRLIATQWDASAPVRTYEELYTFSRTSLKRAIAGIAEAGSVLVVGHNPALEDLATQLTGQAARMVTSAVAVIEYASSDRWLNDGTLQFCGRPGG